MTAAALNDGLAFQKDLKKANSDARVQQDKVDRLANFMTNMGVDGKSIADGTALWPEMASSKLLTVTCVTEKAEIAARLPNSSHDTRCFAAKAAKALLIDKTRAAA